MSQRYNVQYYSTTQIGPITIVLRKLPGYVCEVFLSDILNRVVASEMEREVSEVTETDVPQFVIDVNISQLDDIDGDNDNGELICLHVILLYIIDSMIRHNDNSFSLIRSMHMSYKVTKSGVFLWTPIGYDFLAVPKLGWLLNFMTQT